MRSGRTVDTGDASVPTLDLRGLRCPLPVLKTAKRLAAMRPGDRLAVLADDPLAAIDLPAFCLQEGQRLAAVTALGGGASRYLVERSERRPSLGEV